MAAPVKLFCKEGEVVSHQEAVDLILDWAKKQMKVQDDTIIVIPVVSLFGKDLSLSLATIRRTALRFLIPAADRRLHLVRALSA